MSRSKIFPGLFRFTIFFGLGLLILVGAPCKAAHAAPGGVTGKVSCGDKSVGISIDIEGEITAATVESVSKLFEEFHEQKRKIAAGVTCNDAAAQESLPDFSAYGDHYGINSRGGSVRAAMAIGRMLRQENAWIGVNGVCFSACVFILAGAVDRHIAEASQVGIHRPYLGSRSDSPVATDKVKQSYSRLLQDMQSYLREMNISPRLASDMLAIEPENNRLLTKAELESYRLIGVDPAEQQRRAVQREIADIQEANQLGLDRMEYTRRKHLGERLCAHLADGKLAKGVQYWDCKKRLLKTGIQ